jgi:hypothetical protein
VSSKGPVEPKLWKNSFFWFAVALLGLAIFGTIAGDPAIRDPGQVVEGHLNLFYLGGAVVMAVTGLITHLLAKKAFQEEKEAEAA